MKNKALKFFAGADAAKPVPRLGYFVLLALFSGASAALLWASTGRLVRTFQNFQMFRKQPLSHLLAPAPAAVSEEAASPAEDAAGETPSKKPRPVVFRLLAPSAKVVYLGGSFNDFDGRHHPLTRRPDGVWETTLDLAPGRYEYKFKVDGVWTLDPTNPEKTSEPRSASLLDIH